MLTKVSILMWSLQADSQIYAFTRMLGTVYSIT